MKSIADSNSWARLAMLAHVVPFVCWLMLMTVLDLDMFGPPHPWKYALRTVVCLVLLFWYRPWRWYGAFRLCHFPVAVAGGVFVFVLWVVPEIRWSADLSAMQDFYMRFCIMPLGRLPETGDSMIYSPAAAGWLYVMVRLAGSAFVIAVIEEFFWRGFLYRWIINRKFLAVSMARFDWEALAITVLLFGIEHDRWLAGAAAGIVYLWIMLRTNDIWAAALAHVITNFLLGIYVIVFNHYAFW